jgi:hypothetical protein
MSRHRAYTLGLAILAVLILLNGLVTVYVWSRLEGDESHTRTVQVAGGPVAKCLLETMEAVEPLLLRVPSVEKPLAAYVRLQSVRYPGVVCPEKR